MKLVAHIGIHKTGSTAVQEVCRRQSPWLRAQGVVYPIGHLERHSGQHSDLARLARASDSAALDRFFDRAAAEAQAANAEVVFLSGEELAPMEQQAIDRLVASAHRHFEEMTCILVLRRKREFLYSQFRHHLRAVPNQVFACFFREQMFFSPRESVRAWRQALGEANVLLFRYEDHHHDLVRRLLYSALGVRLPRDVDASARANASIDYFSGMLINDVMKEVEGVDLAQCARIYWEVFGDYRPTFCVEEAVRRCLDTTYSDSDWRIESTNDSTSSADFSTNETTEARDASPLEVGRYLENFEELVRRLRLLVEGQNSGQLLCLDDDE